MATVLVTGVGRGLGLELARQYAAEGWRVIGTLRDMAKAGDVHAVAPSAELHPLDVEDAASVGALAASLAGEAIDLLVSNSGAYRSRASALGPIDYEDWEQTLRVNTLGPIRVATAFVEPVARSQGRRMVVFSSRLGSIASCDVGRSIAYRTSKAALNMAWRCLALDLAPRGVTVTALHPGWVRTAMGGPNAPLAPADAVRTIRRTVAGLGPQHSGQFFDHDGTPLPW